MNTVNIIAPNDADFYRTFLYKEEGGPPINLTGITMRMVLRKKASDVIAVMELSTEPGDGITILSPATDGKFTILIEQEALERLQVGTYDQSLIMYQGALSTRIWGGTITVEAGPSR